VNAGDFEFLCGLLYEGTGVVMDASKDYLVDTRLTALARAESLTGVADLVRRLRSGSSARLHQRFIEAMLTKETSFFRDHHPFDALAGTILPELIRERSRERQLVIWSGACATGQEIYSVALLIRQQVPELATWALDLIGTDISEQALARAQAGRYSQLEIGRGLASHLLLDFFEQDGLEFCLRDEVRRMVRFHPLNLVRPWPPMPRADLILLRNVLIYFDGSLRKRVLREACRVLRPGGYVLLGGAETMVEDGSCLEPVQVGKAVVFRKSSDAGERV
jgi:chemotaxis protein methyltransferase CheR